MQKRTTRERVESTFSSEEDDLKSSSSSSSCFEDDQESVSSEEERLRNAFNSDQKKPVTSKKPMIDLSSIKLLSYDDMATSGKNNKSKTLNKSNGKDKKTAMDAGKRAAATRTRSQSSASMASTAEKKATTRSQRSASVASTTEEKATTRSQRSASVASTEEKDTSTRSQRSVSLASAEEKSSVSSKASKSKPLPSESPNAIENNAIESEEKDKDDSDAEASDNDDDASAQHEASSHHEEEKASLATSKTSRSQNRTNVWEKREGQLKKQLRSHVHRQAKLAKKFELRHIIRMLQKAKSKANGQNRVANLEERLEKTKKIDIEDLVSASLSAAEKEFLVAQPQVTNEKAVEAKEEDEEEKQVDEEGKTSASDEEEDNASVAFVTLNDPVLINLCLFEPLKTAAKEFFERPLRERKRRERERLQKALEAEREAKQLERQKNPLLCGIHMCMARFATEEARTTHRIKRHKTTGDWKKDMEMGLRTKKPNQRERKAFELLKKGGPLEEIDELLRPPKHLRKTPSAKEKLEKQKAAAEEKGEDSFNDKFDIPVRKQQVSHRDKPNDRRPFQKSDRVPSELPQRSFAVKDDSVPAQRFKQQSSISAEKPVSRSAGFGDRKMDEVKRQRPAVRDDKPVHKPREKSQEPALHPSWEAKKKQTLVAEFQGSKVEFDEDDD